MTDHRPHPSRFVVFFVLLVLCASFSAAQDSGGGNVVFAPVISDRNVTEKADALQSERFYVVDGDESKGQAVLVFEGVPRPREAFLILNIADIDWADSNDGFEVALAGSPIASVSKLARNSWLQVRLDPSRLPEKGNFELTIRTSKTDGFYVCSKKSGRGAVLRLIY